MGKTFNKFTNQKKAEGRARKKAKEDEKKMIEEAKKKAEEDAYWAIGVKKPSPSDIAKEKEIEKAKKKQQLKEAYEKEYNSL